MKLCLEKKILDFTSNQSELDMDVITVLNLKLDSVHMNKWDLTYLVTICVHL